MSYNSDYLFNKTTNIFGDETYADLMSIQNAAACNYLTQNYFAADCTMDNVRSFATAQPGIMFQGGHNVGSCGYNIDDSSKLQIGSIQTNPKGKINLFHRPFATVPLLKRGSVDSDMESQMKQGEQWTNRRSVNGLSERTYADHYRTPLIPHVKERIDGMTQKLDNWSNNHRERGGISTRGNR